MLTSIKCFRRKGEREAEERERERENGITWNNRTLEQLSLTPSLSAGLTYGGRSRL